MASAIAIPAQGAVDADVITLATTAKSEITALQAGTSIAGVNGVTMPAGGALTTGAVLRATGVATAAYGAVNLASSDAVTGLLSGANMVAATTLVPGSMSAADKVLLDAGMTASKRTLTADHTTLVAAAATETVNIGAALPANARIVGVDLHTYTPFSGGTVGDFTVDIGTAGDVDALIDGADLFAAAVDGGPATIPQGIRPNKSMGAVQLIATFRCGSDDVADATAGAITIDVLYIVLA